MINMIGMCRLLGYLLRNQDCFLISELLIMIMMISMELKLLYVEMLLSDRLIQTDGELFGLFLPDGISLMRISCQGQVQILSEEDPMEQQVTTLFWVLDYSEEMDCLGSPM